MTEKWWVRKRRNTWVAIHPALGVRGVTAKWTAAFGIAYRAARKEAEKVTD